jgi:hypothetical protein
VRYGRRHFLRAEQKPAAANDGRLFVEAMSVIPGHRAAMNPESQDEQREIARCAIAHLRFALARPG